MADKKPEEKKNSVEKKGAVDKKGGGFKKIVTKTNHFVKDMRSETKKIVWPNKKQIINNTLVVLAVMVIAGVFVWGIDAVLSLIVNNFLRQV